MDSKIPFLKLNSGYSMPQLGLGTWLTQPREVDPAMECALKMGYRHFDCAPIYQNEADVGKFFGKHFSDGTLKRDEIFVTSKIWNTFHSQKKAAECIDRSLKDLQLPYLDMCLIHWPMGFHENAEDSEWFPMKNDKIYFSDVDYLETWRALEGAVLAGKVRSIGLSNFNMAQIQRVLDTAKIKPSNLQIELNPFLTQEKLVEWCQSQEIVVCAYHSLGNPTSIFRKSEDMSLFDVPLLKKLATKYSKTIGQILLKWAIQRGTAVIPKAVQPGHIKENCEIWDFQLSNDDVTEISGLNKNFRINSSTRDFSHPHYPFH